MSRPLGKRTNVAEWAQKILAGVEAHFAAALPGDALPERRYVAAGDPNLIAWDCVDGQLFVALQGVGWGPADDQAPLSPKPGTHHSAFSVRHAIYSVQLTRCTPSSGKVNGIPEVPALQAAGIQMMRDAGLMSQALVQIVSDIGRDPSLMHGGLAQAGIVNPLGPEGGLHGVEGTIAITTGDLEA